MAEEDTAILKAVEELVLSEVRKKDHRPLELLESLSEHYSSAELKLALAQLLHDGQIELTSGRVLRASAGA